MISTVAAPPCSDVKACVAGKSASIQPGISAIAKSTLTRKCTKTSIMK